MRSNDVWSILSVFSIIADFRCQPYLKKDTGRPVIYGTEETNNSPVKVAVFDHFTDFNDLTLCLGKELRQLFPGIR